MWHILDENKNVVPADDATMFNRTDRKVGDTIQGNYHISTVFLCIDHSYGVGEPLFFETMVFKRGSWRDLDMQRYSTYTQAVEGHKAMCKKWNFWRRQAETINSFITR
jgi:hypothetical protein